MNKRIVIAGLFLIAQIGDMQAASFGKQEEIAKNNAARNAMAVLELDFDDQDDINYVITLMNNENVTRSLNIPSALPKEERTALRTIADYLLTFDTTISDEQRKIINTYLNPPAAAAPAPKAKNQSQESPFKNEIDRIEDTLRSIGAAALDTIIDVHDTALSDMQAILKRIAAARLKLKTKDQPTFDQKHASVKGTLNNRVKELQAKLVEFNKKKAARDLEESKKAAAASAAASAGPASGQRKAPVVIPPAPARPASSTKMKNSASQRYAELQAMYAQEEEQERQEKEARELDILQKNEAIKKLIPTTNHALDLHLGMRAGILLNQPNRFTPEQIRKEVTSIINSTHNYLIGPDETTRMATISVINHIQNNLIIYYQNGTINQDASIENLNNIITVDGFEGLVIIRNLLIAFIQAGGTKDNLIDLLKTLKQDDYTRFERLTDQELNLMSTNIIATLVKIYEDKLKFLQEIVCSKTTLNDIDFFKGYVASLLKGDGLKNTKPILELFTTLLYPSGIFSDPTNKKREINQLKLLKELCIGITTMILHQQTIQSSSSFSSSSFSKPTK